MKYLLLFVLSLGLIQYASGYDQKNVKINRIKRVPTIDGRIQENEYAEMVLLNDFSQYEPYNGKAPSEKSEVWVGYDDYAFYVGAIFYDSEPEKISRIVSQRDQINEDINDIISLIISPYGDRNNAISFVVSATGAQLDRKCMGDIVDDSWDAVWESATNINDQGWSVEIKIPYSAIRIPKKEIQDWGFNICRRDNDKSEWSTWSYANNENSEMFNYYGILSGFENIKPPLRLSLTPYISGYMENNTQNNWESSFNAGMDLKYGINESFTLDAILIPDFGQVQSDDQELNLSPYEIKFNENRQFFTEGMELFNKGNIFYTRRIGGMPSGYSNVSSQLLADEEIKENPIESKLINAFKISGRNKNGLGIGVFNAMTSKSEAKIYNPITDERRNVETQSFTNYNLLVVDKLISKNSYVSLINTNVSRDNFVANVIATEFKLADKENNYAVNGTGSLSYREVLSNSETGYAINLHAAKLSGKFKYSYTFDVSDDKYNPNDMGYLRQNNQMTNRVRFDYNIYKPFRNFLNVTNYMLFNYERLYNPSEYSEFYISYQIGATLKNRTYLEMHALWRPIEEVNHFEARVPGRKVNMSKGFHNCFTYSTDSRKAFSIMLHGGFYFSDNFITDYNTYSIVLRPTYTVNNRMLISLHSYYGVSNNAIGFVTKNDDDIYMGERNVQTIENALSFKYMLNSDLSLSIRGRHYWSEAKYDNFYDLLENGDLQENDYSENHDINYNALTIDAAVNWNFQPGSEISLVWKNNLYSSDKNINETYFKNLSNTFEASHENSLSIKILYYIDYQSIKKSLESILSK